MLWLRMLLSIIVSIYTSRVVLQTLGVEDYGIYNVVGGVTAMFTFLNATMAGATSRFLTYEMGQGNSHRLQETFSSALIVHLGLALIVFIMAETVGLWFLTHKLVIPEDRMFAAHFVYQCTIISIFIKFTQSPYDATIVAHKEMNVYAYIELINAILKLAIVFLLLIGNFDKLILYAILLLLVTFMIAMIYRIYCVRRYQETHFHWVWKPSLLKPLLSFSIWNLLGNMSVSVKTQGSNFLLNIFFGAKVNAAAGIATTIQGIITGFAFNIVTAFRPQIIKAYAKGNVVDMYQLLQLGIKFTVAFVVLVALPAYWELDYILKLWLGNVPQYTADFLRIILIYIPFQSITSVLNVLIQASANIRNANILMGSVFSLTLVPIYLCFHFGYPPSASYVAMTVSCLFVLVGTSLIIKYQIKLQGIIKFVVSIILYNIVIAISISFLIHYFQKIFPESFLRLSLTSIASTIIYICSFYCLLLDKQQQRQVLIWIKSKF